ncbi:MAG TPA: chitobiase/beta-hexosaminidase C-terminal domain-containing protein [Verrucomicrobiae bacterium]|nr:chitobiase/beta-hexosaminidase C-terminal domain-containing protein [Verrucomicrobiae bacterium]
MLRLLCCFSTDPAFKSSLSSAQRATCQLKLARFSASLFLAVFCSLFPLIAPAQTGFLDFNTPGQYTKNFNPSDAGTPDGNYSFAESPTAGVGGSGGVSVFQSSDTTAVYTNRSWDFSVNGARLFLSTLVKANGQSSGNKVQLGILNENNNALNNNAGVAFESFRFIPTSATDWSVREQYRSNNTLTENVLGDAVPIPGHWYKFVVSLTNTAGASGSYTAGCAIYDYGTNGLTPGTNIATFPTGRNNSGQTDVTIPAVWPALRAFQNGGIDAWDNFLVYTPSSAPIITLGLTNTTVAAGTSATFLTLVDGPGTISLAWYTNGVKVAGATGNTYTTPPVDNSYATIAVVASNSNGSVTNEAGFNVIVPSTASVANLPAFNIQTRSVTLDGQVLNTGGDAPAITIFYGPTDGGTNSAAWASSVSPGVSSGAFSQTVSGLTPGTTYFFNAQAVNISGTSWATPSQSFTTLAITPPAVTNLPASFILSSSATLNGQVTATGNEAPTVTLFYGPADGGSNAGAWSNSANLGVQAGLFSQNIANLNSNATYYYSAQAVNSAGTRWAIPSQSFRTLATNPPAAPGVAVLTYHNDNTRQGVNASERTLTLANVNTNTFGKLFSYPVDGFVYAQPLIMTNVNVPGKGTHNVLYVATEHNSLYAFDADDNSGANASPLWQTSFLGPGVTTVPNGDVGTTDITPEVGVTSTPVIDPVTGTIYVEVKTKEGTAYVHRLHALDIATGLERTNFNSPSVISCNNYPGRGTGDNDGQNPPHVLWNPLKEHCRPALTLLNGVIYMSFASHGDNQPYHGWMFAYNATNVAQQVGTYNATPNGGLGGFWDGGGGPSVDPQGNLYFQTGNGDFNGGTTVTSTNNYAMSLLKLATTNGLTLVDYFAPNNAVALSGGDQDLGSSAPLILPDSAGSAAHPHLVVGGGKTAPIYLVDRDNMGRFNGSGNPNNIVQQFNGGPGGDRDVAPAFFNNTLYIIDSNSRIGAYTISNAQFNTTPVESPDGYNNKGGASVSISANGTSNAIAWAMYNSGGQSPNTPAVLRAYNAANLTRELYSSDQIPSRDSAGDAVKFTLPTIANGKVYVGAQYSVTVYGLSLSFLDTPSITPNGGTFTNSVVVTITDSSPGVTIYYTIDGTVPTIRSSIYNGPFTLTNSAAVQAFAAKAGAVNSGVASAEFLDSSAIGSGTGLLGQYFANQLMTFVPPPTLLRTDAVVNFNWNTVSPDPSIPPTDYTVRWTGMVQPQFNETYTFSTTTDDGVRLWVNGKLLIDEWIDQGPTTWSGTIALQAQQYYNIQMDFYQNQGGAVASLSWASPSTPLAIIPTTQLYAVTNPPPVIILTEPANSSTYAASASVTVSANAAAQFNDIKEVDFFQNSTFLGAVSNAPYTLTLTGLGQGSYSLMAVAQDTTGLAATSAPVNITVTAGTGLPYGLAARVPVSPFLNMPPTIEGTVPALLSQTGVFTNTPSMGAMNGLIPYDVNVPLWSDGAIKTRWMSVPNSGAPFSPDEQVGFGPTGEWTFPMGTVFVKHFDLETDFSNPNGPKRRLETRLLVRDPNGSVYGVTYKWRPDNSDADLLNSSLSEPITITNADHTTWTQTWYYPSPADCLTCHTPAANYVLGVKTRQLNKSFGYPSGVQDNELRALNHIGLFNPAFSEASIAGYDHLSALTNLSASLEERARSYLDANCAQCHRPGGSGVTFDARYDTPLANQNIINALLIKGDLGIDHARVVVPQDIWRSILLARMNSLDDAVKMPPLARNLIDTNAVQVMGDWINSLPGTPALAPPTISPAGGTFSGSILVTLQDTNPAAVLYFTLDGSLPDTNSFVYSAPVLLTNSATFRANAFEPGFVNSAAASGLFTILSTIPSGPSFTGTSYVSNGVFSAQLSGATNNSYVLQGSTNFQNWVSLSTNVPGSSPFTIRDPQAGAFRYRFYRVLQQP